MTESRPVSVSEVRSRASRAVERDFRTWASDGGDDARLAVALRPPTERHVLAGVEAARSWAESWREAEGGMPVDVEWVERRWANVGRQRVPVRVVVRGADAIATVGGNAALETWTRARDRAGQVRERLVALGASEDVIRPVIRQQARALAALDDQDFATLLDVVAWLVANPVSGQRVRQVPVRGIHTKWLESRLALVNALHRAVTGHEDLGVVRKEELIRVRFLDDALAPGAPRDLATTAAHLAALEVVPRAVLVLENLETLLSLPALGGVIAVHGGGNAVASRLRHVPWVRTSPVVYWGDLDTYGFQILARLRAEHLAVRSILMDERTLMLCRDLWGTESSPADVTTEMLTESECAALARLGVEGGIRLEQERIPWGPALEAVVDAVT